MTDQFTYISAFLSIVVALALTHLLAGFAAIVRARVLRVSWPHAAWMGIFLFGCVDYWFSLWGLRATTQWSLGYVLYLLGLATLLYIGCHLVMPRARDDDALDLVAFDDANRRGYLAAFGIYIAVATIANLTISGFATAVWMNVVSFVLVAIAWARRDDARVQRAVAVVLVACIAWYAVTYIPAL